MNLQRHRDQNQVILNEFTNQAALPENRIPGLTNLSAIELLIETSGVTDEESVLDVACGGAMWLAPSPRAPGKWPALI